MCRVLTKPILLTDPLDILIQGCRENDLSCQEQLYRYCYPEMIRTCYRYAGYMDGAGIIFNNAMLRVFKNIHSYSEQGKLTGWIKTIMAGNVAEWCQDWFDPQYNYNSDTQTNPPGPSSGFGHVIRGGHWGAHPFECEVTAFRMGYSNDRDAHVGFRLVLIP